MIQKCAEVLCLFNNHLNCCAERMESSSLCFVEAIHWWSFPLAEVNDNKFRRQSIFGFTCSSHGFPNITSWLMRRTLKDSVVLYSLLENDTFFTNGACLVLPSARIMVETSVSLGF